MNKFPVFSANASDPAFYQNPYPYYQKMHTLGPLFYWQEYDLVCASRFDVVSTILRDKRFGREITLETATSAAEPLVEMPVFNLLEKNSMLEREPPTHTRLRRLVNKAFVSRKIEHLKPEIEKLCHDLIDRFENNKVELLSAYAEIIPVTIIANLLGVATSMNNQLLDWSHKMVAMYQFDKSDETVKLAEKASAEFYDYIVDIANARKLNPKDDLISALVSVHEQGENLTQDEMVSTCILLLNAGHEATVHAIGNSVYSLLSNSIDCASIFMDESSTYKAVEELLRFEPPLHMFKRFVLEDINIEGFALKAGENIGLLYGAANHDPEKFPVPSKLDFDRRVGQIAFGSGIHFCLGAPLARMELAIALPILFKRLPNLKLAGQNHFANRYHFRGLETLNCEF